LNRKINKHLTGRTDPAVFCLDSMLLSVGCVKIGSIAVERRAVMALIEILYLRRKHSRHKTEKRIIGEFDMTIRHGNEESDVEDESLFDLQNDATEYGDLTGSESGVGEDDFRGHFEDEAFFSFERHRERNIRDLKRRWCSCVSLGLIFRVHSMACGRRENHPSAIKQSKGRERKRRRGGTSRERTKSE
jgi:hypothetical protein